MTVCSHPELRPTQWNQPRPEPAEMIGACDHNKICPVCGFGWGCSPDPCQSQQRVPFQVTHGLLP